MKKFLVAFVVLSLVCLSSMALAADVTVGGSVQIRSRNFSTMTFDKNVSTTADQVDTQERIMIDVNAKAGDNVKGKISLWNDWETWEDFETAQGNGFHSSGVSANQFGFREAWMSFNLPDIPVNVTVGHQLLKLGNGWFFRSQHYGSDAWVISNKTGNNTIGFLNVKIEEGTAQRANDDEDAYVLFDVFKLNENMAIGVDFTQVTRSPARDDKLQNIGANFNGKLGPVNLQAEVDVQMGKDKGVTPNSKYKGMQAVVQGNVAMDPLTVKFLVGYGTGNKSGSNDTDAYQTFLDSDPHYSFMYEYKLRTACGATRTGFCNTTAISAGVMFAAAKSLSVGLDAYYLMATEKITSPAGESTDDLGTEIDAKVQWKLYDNLTWNWDIGYFMPGKAYKTAAGKDDEPLGIQGVLAFKF